MASNQDLPERSNKPFPDALNDAIAETRRRDPASKMTRHRVAEEIELDPSFFFKALRGDGGKRLNVGHMRRISRRLDLPDDYFVELREARIVEAAQQDPELRDWLYDQVITRVGLGPRRDRAW